ncbi:MAG: hypothetical protein AAGI08_12665 [Bacteroidota bacterium]
MSVREIETAITKLSKRELAELAVWFNRYHEAAWDRQMEEDLEAGHLDALLSEVDAEIENEGTLPL